jgi:hypothetical protein
MKKFIISTIFTTIIFVWWYYLLTLYDVNNTILPRVITNKYYILFLYISIVAWFWIYREDNNKSKLLVFLIFLLNFLYLCSIFLIWNIWLTKIQCLIFIWLLVVWFLATLIKNWIGYIIIFLSIIWDILLLYISIVPLYENWPDIEWFDNQFETEFIISSNAWINKEKASIIKDTKEYEILNGTNEYNFYIKKWWSEILFKSDNLYKNSYWFILFRWWEFIEITPQSAIKINEDYEIEVLWWNIKYYPENPKEFKITKKLNEDKKTKTWDIHEKTWDIDVNTWNIDINTWDNQVSWDIQTWENKEITWEKQEIKQNTTQQEKINIQIEENEEIINITRYIYNKKLRYYIKQQIWWNLQLDIRILKLSEKTLELLIRINPKYQDNMDNLQKYLEIFEINLQEYNFRQDSNFWETINIIKESFSSAVKSLEE